MGYQLILFYFPMSIVIVNQIRIVIIIAIAIVIVIVIAGFRDLFKLGWMFIMLLCFLHLQC